MGLASTAPANMSSLKQAIRLNLTVGYTEVEELWEWTKDPVGTLHSMIAKYFPGKLFKVNFRVKCPGEKPTWVHVAPDKSVLEELKTEKDERWELIEIRVDYENCPLAPVSFLVGGPSVDLNTFAACVAHQTAVQCCCANEDMMVEANGKGGFPGPPVPPTSFMSAQGVVFTEKGYPTPECTAALCSVSPTNWDGATGEQQTDGNLLFRKHHHPKPKPPKPKPKPVVQKQKVIIPRPMQEIVLSENATDCSANDVYLKAIEMVSSEGLTLNVALFTSDNQYIDPDIKSMREEFGQTINIYGLVLGQVQKKDRANFFANPRKRPCTEGEDCMPMPPPSTQKIELIVQINNNEEHYKISTNNTLMKIAKELFDNGDVHAPEEVEFKTMDGKVLSPRTKIGVLGLTDGETICASPVTENM